MLLFGGCQDIVEQQARVRGDPLNPSFWLEPQQVPNQLNEMCLMSFGPLQEHVKYMLIELTMAVDVINSASEGVIIYLYSLINSYTIFLKQKQADVT